MQAKEFWKVVTADRVDFLDRLISTLEEHAIRFCLVGGQGVNAYVEPVVSLDLDIAVATDDLARVGVVLRERFGTVELFPHSLNVSDAGSDLRVQIQTDPRYGGFVDRAVTHDVLGRRLPVAAIEDVLQGKVWAALDETRRPSKRQKDLADIARLIEAYPALRSQVPEQILSKLI